jgi:hypothetical protein
MSKRVSAVGIGRKLKYNKHLWLRGIFSIDCRRLAIERSLCRFDGIDTLLEPRELYLIGNE